MTAAIRKRLSARPDLQAIAEIIPPDVKVLDLGCGDGSLLQLLRKEKNVEGCGIEISQDKILACVASGVPVLHGNLNDGLEDFPDKSFDYVVLSQTLQAVKRPDLLLDEMARVGQRVIISFINIGFWKARFQLTFLGRMPVTRTLPNRWYDTPNIHLGTIRDFRELCKLKQHRIKEEIPLGGGLAKLIPNLFSRTCVFVIEG